MKIEAVGRFLPDEILMEARMKYAVGLLDDGQLADIEDGAVRDVVERQIARGLPYVASGELRGKHRAKDFWFGLKGIACDYAAPWHIYQLTEVPVGQLRLAERIAYNPEHPLFRDFAFLHDAVAGRALCRQSLPSPANLLLEIFSLTDGHPEPLYLSADALVADIAEAYRLTLLQLHELGCASVLFDDTACGLMGDDGFTDRFLQGGVDIIGLQRLIIDVINASVEGLPDDMETAVCLSGGENVVPEWEAVRYPGNMMPAVLESLRVDKFFLPFDGDNDSSLEVLRHVPEGKKVVLGLVEAGSPFPDDASALSSAIRRAMRYVSPDCLYISPKTGFRLPDYCDRGLSDEEQWRRLSEFAALS